MAREWQKVSEKDRQWSVGYAEKIVRYLELHVFPWIGRLPVGDIKPTEVVRCLHRIKERGHLETEMRVRDTIQHVYQYAVDTGVLEPAKNFVNGRTGGLPAVRSRHYPAITDPTQVGHQTCTGVPAMRRQIECLRVLGGELNALEVNCGSTDFLRASHWSRMALAGHAQHLPPRCTTVLIPQLTAVTRKRIALAYGLYIEYTEVTLGTKNNMKTEYGRIGLRRFWVPCALRRDEGRSSVGLPG
ncbi:tyrosine-type recombinase/integrase [Burkholderia multivorans]|uniref:tyrosine-type recombinase/integrase n=1 Tax=Burkholderia multivorans TaxID=87883 RepID=UPI003F54D795